MHDTTSAFIQGRRKRTTFTSNQGIQNKSYGELNEHVNHISSDFQLNDLAYPYSQ